MPRSRGILPEGAPSELFDYFDAHPGSTLAEGRAALKLSLSTTYYALTRLADLALIEHSDRRKPHRWRVRERPPEPAPTPTVAAPAEDNVRERLAARLRPTGTQYTVVDGAIHLSSGAVQLFAVSGKKNNAPVVATP